jgi:hypothetical protein
VGLVSCNRAHYRRQADAEVYAIIRDAMNHPNWPLARYQIDVDPRSRMFSPFSIDRPPMPPDDPASHTYMHYVDGKRGWPHWEDNGVTRWVENPGWLAALPLSEDGVLRVDMDRAVQLALLNSSSYQSELEELYLSALDVSFERFRFDAQFFAGYGGFFTTQGNLDNGPKTIDSRSDFRLGTVPDFGPIRMQKLCTTGSEMVVGLANSLVWQFVGPNSYDATTLLDFAFVQPLLRGAGRARVMERLTIAERTLLANVRMMERYRREFYVEITTGRPAGNGPERRGGFFGGSGLEGFTGVGGGGFGRVGSSGQGFAGGAGAPEAGGLIGLLQSQQNLRLQQSNIAALRNGVIQLDAFFQADRIDYFQVELARQALLNAQSRWLNSNQTYEADVDEFKRDLGLPPGLALQVNDSFLAPFNLIDPALVAEQNNLADLQTDLGEAVLSLTHQEDGQLVPAADVGPSLKRIVIDLDEVKQLQERVASQLVQEVHADIERLRAAIPGRRRDLARLRQKFSTRDGSLLLSSPDDETAARTELADITRNAFDLDRLLALPDELDRALTQLEERLRQTRSRLEQLRANCEQLAQQHDTLSDEQLNTRLRDTVAGPIPNELRDLYGDLLELSLVQARARTESITLLPVDLDWQTAYEIARQNRRDWMNARAGLVDTWRLIQFNANALRSEMDIVFTGDIDYHHDSSNPLKLDDTTGHLRAGVQFDAPLTRLSERNTYRQSLIEYDQARRNYYRFEDRIGQLLRGTIRRIELNQLNFELLRSAVRVSISQVELAQLRLQEPPRPEVESVLGATTARDLVTALSDLLNAQTDFLSVWVNYEVLRRGLDLDLGTMQLDPDGVWIDPGPIRADLLLDAEPLEPPVPGGELLPVPQAMEEPAFLQVGYESENDHSGESP